MGDNKMTPAVSDEEMEAKMIALAIKQAQKQLERGTASSQIVTHYLKLGSKRADIELEHLQLQNRLLEEKILSEQQGLKTQEMIQDVLEALKSYSYAPPGDLSDVEIF